MIGCIYTIKNIVTGKLKFPVTISNAVFHNGIALSSIIDSLSTESSWAGKTAIFLGDSITQGVNTIKRYDEYLKEIFSWTTYNHGISGSTISNVSNPMCTRYNSLESSADIVFVFGGTNDFYFNVPLGDWYSESSGTRTFNTDTATFRGALVTLCKGLINKYPTSQIVLLTPLHRSTFDSQPTEMQTNSIGLYIESYVESIKEAGKIFSIPVIDLYSRSGLRPSETASNDNYFNATDKLHPNNFGHQRIALTIQGELNVVLPTKQ